MKTLMKTGLILGAFLLFTSTAWSLPMAGDIVKMTVAPGANYGMTVTKVGANSQSTVEDFFNTFCVEHTEYFNDGRTYKVQSVGTVATRGGTNKGQNVSTVFSNIGDPISDISRWLYASFFDGVFDNITNSYGRKFTQTQLADKVQNAIWFEEDEISDRSDYDTLTALADDDYTYTGWDIQVVNIIDRCTSEFKQSQLTGSRVAPVPEPATMILFGIGLLGLAGIGRKNKQNKLPSHIQ